MKTLEQLCKRELNEVGITRKVCKHINYKVTCPVIDETFQCGYKPRHEEIRIELGQLRRYLK